MNDYYFTFPDGGDGQILAIAYVPMQNADFGALYAPDDALCAGTVFPALDLPFSGKGGAQ